ncbi:hypothetical protein GW17_00045228 [Ensete ventricosum]|nr:hypothetical protein GW17_00045228 [Ensete ventricosum]
MERRWSMVGWREPSGLTRSFYSGCYRSFIPEIFTASITYHVIVLLHTVRGPCSEARDLPVAAVTCQPYLCQVDRTIANSFMPMSGRLCCVRSAMLKV